MSDIDLDGLETLAKAATAEPGDNECRHCGALCARAYEDEPSALCNGCSHVIAEELGRALLAMARRTEEAEHEAAEERHAALHAERERDRLAAQLEIYAANHGARCDAEQERYATIAESACRMLARTRRDIEHLADYSDETMPRPGLVANLRACARVVELFLSAPGHEVPGLRAKLADRDAALDACAARIAEVMRERDEARAALAEVQRASDAGSAVLDEALESLKRNAPDIPDVEISAEFIAALCDEGRAAVQGGGLPAPSAKPLDPAHVEVLREMRRRANLELAGAEHDERLGTLSPGTVEWYRKRSAALEAVLGEEASP